MPDAILTNNYKRRCRNEKDKAANNDGKEVFAMDFGKSTLGIELGSTRIKAVLIDENHIPVASGDYEWENQLVNGIWTYSMDIIHKGVQACFAALRENVKSAYGVELESVGAIGISAMMHGYLPFDKDDHQLAEFRTWRNTITGAAAEELT